MHPSDFSKRKEHVFHRYAHKRSSNRKRPVSTFPTQKSRMPSCRTRWSNEPSARRGEPELVVSAICFLSGIYSCLLHLTYTFSDSSRAEPSKREAFERSEKSLSFAAKDSRFPHICRALLRFPHLSFLPPVPYPPLRGTFPVRGLTIRENH